MNELQTRPFRAGIIVSLVLASCLGVLFHRSILNGEIFSPADLLFSFYPWAHGEARIEPANSSRSDEALYHQPLMTTHWRHLKKGLLPDYDPLRLGGVPAFFQGLNAGQIVSPFSLPFYLAPADIAVTIAAPLRLLCAGLFMWMFLRVGLSQPAAIAGAVAFALNGAFIVWLSAPMPTIALWMPLSLLFVERIVLAPATKKGLPESFFALALVLGLALTGAYLPTSLVLLGATAAYASMWVAITRRWGRGLVALLALGGGLAIGAAALLPMLANLTTSPAAARHASRAFLPAANVATFALPDFWGNPVDGTWWHPGDGNYPEFVTYLGVVTLMLAGAGVARFGLRERQPRVLILTALAGASLAYMYGVPPFSWLGALPGLRQTNPFRVNVATAFAAAALAGYGVEAMRRGPGLKAGATADLKAGSTADLKAGTAAGDERWWTLGGAVVMALALALAAVLPTLSYLPEIRARHLQEYEKAQIVRFAVLAAATFALLAVAAWRSPRASRFRVPLGAAVTVLIAVDLISALWRFNPTLPRDRVYPGAPGLAFLQREARGGARIAPLGEGHGLPPGHVWSVYGLASLTGFDFHGDAAYQQLIARAQGREPHAPRWDYVGLDGQTIDLRLLGLLNARFLVTSPEDVAPRLGGFTTVGELTTGRVVRQSFAASRNGLRRVDVLAATLGRANGGEIEFALHEQESGRVVASRASRGVDVRDLAWLTLEFPPLADSRAKRYVIEVRAIGGAPGRSVTLMASAGDDFAGGLLELDGREEQRDLWFRSFATAPDRFEGATLVYAHDLNIYRNERAQPRAWFAGAVEAVPREAQLARLADPTFDASRVALVDPSEAIARAQPLDARAPARVLALDVAAPDDRRFTLEAPSGGLLVISERAHPGWRAWIDGEPAPLIPVNFVLLGVQVPAGAREVRLEYRLPWMRTGLLISALAMAAALGVAVLESIRSPSRL